LSLSGFLRRSLLRKRIASWRRITKLGEARFKTMTLAFSAGVNRRVGFMQREAATSGEICQPVAGSTAGISMNFLYCCSGCFLSTPPARHVVKRRSRFEKLSV